jgi:hypothetical protein
MTGLPATLHPAVVRSGAVATPVDAPLLVLQRAGVRFGAQVALRDISLQIRRGACRTPQRQRRQPKEPPAVTRRA